MLEEIHIEGFKAIHSASLTLSPFTLLIGRNSTGKSSVLEALQWLRDSARFGLEEATRTRYGTFDELRNRRSQKMTLELLFRQPGGQRTRYKLRVRAGTKNVYYRPIVDLEECGLGQTSGRKKEISSRLNPKERRGAPFRWLHGKGAAVVVKSGDELALSLAPSRVPGAGALADVLSNAVFLRLSPTAMAQEFNVRRKSGKTLLAEDGADLPLLIESLSAEARRALVKRVMALFPSVKNIEVRADGDARHLTVSEHMISRGGKRTHSIPAWLLSEGMRRIVAIFALLEARPRPSLLAIEEIENGLDPWTLAYVLGELHQASAEGVQVIVTTHSPFLLDHVDIDEVIHVHRRSGESTYQRVTDLPKVAKYKGVLAPGAMYLRKLFGSEEMEPRAAKR